MARVLVRFATALIVALLGFVGVATAEDYEVGLEAYEAGEYDRAYEIWRPLADDGDPVAQYSLGKLFERGGGAVTQDFDQAARWYRLAAQQGVASAQNNLALMYAQGRGVPPDLGRAIHLWRKAAEQDNEMAQYNLGLAFFRGEGIKKDEQKAAHWFRRAADGGLGDAEYAMGQMRRLGLVLETDPGEALAWYQRAAAKGHGEAIRQAQLMEAADITPKEPAPIAETELAEESPAAEESNEQAVAIDQAAESGSEAAAPAESQTQMATATAMTQEGVEDMGQDRSADTETAAALPMPRRKPAVPQLSMSAGPSNAAAMVGGTGAPPAREPEAAEQSEASEEDEGAGGPTLPAADQETQTDSHPDKGAAAEPASETVQMTKTEAPAKTVNGGSPEVPASGAAPAASMDTGSEAESAAQVAEATDVPAVPAAPSETEAVAKSAPKAQPQFVVATPPQPAAKSPATTQVATPPQPAKSPTATQVAAKTVKPAAGGSVRVWLGSGRNEKSAMGLWTETRDRFADLLSESEPSVKRVVMGDDGVFFRLMAGPLDSHDAAQDLCALMRLKDEDAFCKVLPN